MLRWTPGLRGRDRHVCGCRWLTVRPLWIICLYSKGPPELALLEAWKRFRFFPNFSSSCKPSRGLYFKQKKTKTLAWWLICWEYWSGWRKLPWGFRKSLLVNDLKGCAVSSVRLIWWVKTRCLLSDRPEDYAHARMDMASANKQWMKTLANTDAGITQAFNKLFVRSKLTAGPSRKRRGAVRLERQTEGRAGEGRGTGGTETLTESNKS